MMQDVIYVAPGTAPSPATFRDPIGVPMAVAAAERPREAPEMIPRAAPPVSRVASKAAVDEEVARPASGGAAAASRRDGPMGIAWDLQFLKSLNAALRVGSWLFAIITFAAMDDSVLGGKFSRFKFVLAVGVLVFIHQTLVLAARATSLHERVPRYMDVQLALDFLWLFLSFMSAIMGALQCDADSQLLGSLVERTCNLAGHSAAEAAIAFAFLNSFVFLGPLVFFSFKERQGKGVYDLRCTATG